MKAYILTADYNDYNQHGEYFVAFFMHKPSVEDLKKVLPIPEEKLVSLVNGESVRQDYGMEIDYMIQEVYSNN